MQAAEIQNEFSRVKSIEENLSFNAAAHAYLRLAKKIHDDIGWDDRLPEIYMRAANCFQKASLTTLAYRSWVFCRTALRVRIARRGNEYSDEIKKDLAAAERAFSETFVDRLSPYKITEKKWEYTDLSPATQPTDDEKDWFRAAWVTDFAGINASLKGDHDLARQQYGNAANYWLWSAKFRGHKLIAAKFLSYAACEAIFSLGIKGYKKIRENLTQLIQRMENISLNDPTFYDDSLSPTEPHPYFVLAIYFRAIAAAARGRDLNDVADKASSLEHRAMRKHFRANRRLSKWFADAFLYATTSNGKSLLRFCYTIGVLYLVLIGLFTLCIATDSGAVYCKEEIDRPEQISTELPKGIKAQAKSGIEIEDRPVDVSFHGGLTLAYFTGVTFLTLGYGDCYPIGATRIVSVFGCIFGYASLALFVWLMTQKLR